MPYITLPDRNSLHYLDIGRGPAVVLLHGFGMRAAHWLPFVAPLAMRYRFILPDLRGFGRSHHVNLSQDCLLSNYADDVAHLLDTLGLERVHLGGISMGAYTSLQYLRRHGGARLKGYLHIDQAPMARNVPGWRWGLFGEAHERRMDEFRALIELMESHGRDTAWQSVTPELRARLWRSLAQFMGDAFHNRSLSLGLNWLLRHERIARRVLPPDNWPVYLDVMRAYVDGDYDMRPSLSRIDVPMTVMVGTESVMYPAPGQIWIKSQVRHARVVCFENCGHAVMLEKPRQFVWELARFLSESAALSGAAREPMPRKKAA
jgi:non-heme chloroperoxidase